MSTYNLVAVPRHWVKDWVLEIVTIALGQTIPTMQPLRWILFKGATD